MADGAMGHQARLYVEPGASPHTFDSSSESYEFVREGLRKSAEILDTNGITGSRSHKKERTRAGLNRIGGTILLHPSPNDLELWLPRIMGSASVGVLAETLPSFGVLKDLGTTRHEYKDCKVNRATFRGQAGGLVEMELDILGKSEATGTSAPSVSLGVAADDAPYVHTDLAVSLAAAAREVFDFEITIDNRLEARFVNNVNATALNATDRIITVRATTPWTADEDDLYDVATAGIAATFTFTNGTLSTLFSFAALQIPAETPVVERREGEIRFTINGTARMSGSTRELVVTNDATP